MHTNWLNIYKSLMRPVLDYSDRIFYQHSKAPFSKIKIKLAQHNATLAKNGGYFCDKKCHYKLGQECFYRLDWTRWEGTLCLLYKVFSTGQLPYISKLLPSVRSSRPHGNLFNTISCKSKYYRTLLLLMSLMNGRTWILTFIVQLRITYFVIHN